MNLLDLVPAFSRQLRQYQRAEDTDSTLAAYLADAIEGLNNRWTRTYVVTHTTPLTFEVEPEITAKDKRPIILAASIIYKGATSSFASIRDGDFAYDPQQGRQNPLQVDILELDKLLPNIPRLAQAQSAPMRGFGNVWNPEGYYFEFGLAV